MDCLELGRRSTLGRFTVEPARERFGYYVDRHAFGGDLYDTGSFATWDHVVFELIHGARTCYLAVPADRASRLVEGFGSGQLDELLRRIADTQDSALKPLLAADQIGRGGVFGRIGNGATLQPIERTPGSGAIGGNGSGRREDKRRSEQERSPQHGEPRLPRPPRSLLSVAVPATAAVVVAGVVAAAVLVTRGGGDDPTTTTVAAGPSVEPTGAQPTTSPTTLPTTSPTTLPTTSATASTSVPITQDDISGTFAFVRTVVDGNADNPVGTTSNFTATLTAECDGAACTVTIPGLGTSSTAGGALHFAGTTSLPCPSDPSIQVPHPYDIVLVPVRDATGKVTGFRGTQDLTAQPSSCPNAEIDPVRTEWVGTRN